MVTHDLGGSTAGAGTAVGGGRLFLGGDLWSGASEGVAWRGPDGALAEAASAG